MYGDGKQFEVRQDHLVLLQHANIGWDDGEFGAPAIDCKRPYGNSDVLGDMAEILGFESDDDAYENGGNRFRSDDETTMYRLHSELRIVLQILVDNLQIAVGIYELVDGRWRRK